MQKLKSKFLEKFQIEKKVRSFKNLPKNPAIQIGVAAIIIAGLLSWLHIRPLGLMFIIILCFWFSKNYCNLCLHIPPEMDAHIEAWKNRIILFRQSRPATFCVIASCFSLGVAVLGHYIPGSAVVFAIFVFGTIISIKFNFRIIDIDSKGTGFRFPWNRKLQQEYDMEEEFLPEDNEQNMFFLEKANDLSSRIEDPEDDESKSDEVPSELLIPDSIPEVNESSTDDDQDDLLPLVPVSKSESHIKDANPATDALVRYSNSDDTIEFKKGHFKRDSSLSNTSSSSEESLSKGLKFPDHTAVDGPRPDRPPDMTSNQQEVSRLVGLVGSSQAQALLASSSKLIPSLMTGLVQGVLRVGSGEPLHDTSNRRVVTALDSSDESDFEILEQEDFQ